MIFRLEYKNRNGLQARLDITTPGSSVVKEIEGAEHPFLLSYKGDKSDKSFHFMTSSAEINIYETPEFNIDTLKTSSETQIKVDHYIDSKLNWTGFVIPDFFSREIGGAGVVSMTASDRISTLKGVTLSDLPAMVQIRDLAVRCLAKTGLDLTLKTIADFRATELGFNQYFRSGIASQRLYDSKGRSISCYDILKSILVASGSTLRQRGGEWHIINKLQHEAGAGRVYDTENTSVDYVESVHHFDEIVKGARRTIIPVAGSVGIYHEYGGGKLHPDNYDFSQGLTGWTPVGGFVAGIGSQSVNGYKIESGVYVPDYGEVGLNHLKNANPYQRNVNPIYLESAPIAVPYSGSGAVNIEFDANGIGPMLTTQAVMRIAIVAQKGGELLTLHHGGAFNPMPSSNPPVFEKRFKKGFTNPDFTAGADTQNMRVSGTLESSELEGWELRIRIYGGGSSNTILINAASIHMKSSQETPKGAIYKRDQGADFTKTHDIETAIFGDYLTTGKDGYFYDYPIDDTSSIHNPYSGISSLWSTPYFPTETDALPILQHVVRQQARMFSVAHDLISGEIEIERFDPLSIFIDCNGKRHVIVSASFDFLRSSVRVELEEIAYANLTVRDFIYSYFGEGESGISSVGGISAGTGGGGGGGMTADQVAILSEVQGLAHDHENKEVLDQVTQEVVDNALREMIISTDTESALTDENYLSSLRVLAEILKNNAALKDEFLSKIDPDTAKEAITFLKGIIANGTSYFANLIASGKITTADFEAENAEVTDTLTVKDMISDTLKTKILQAMVRAELEDVILKGQLNSEAFASGFLGEGFRLNKIGPDWVLELDKIIVRKAMEVYELIIQRVRYQGGQVIHSPAGGKITSVTDAGTHWRIEHDSPDSFTTGAQVFCQTVKVGSEAQNPEGLPVIDGVSVKRYWRLVTSYGKGWFNLSKTDMEPGSAEPEIGDEIAVLGHRTDKSQQAAIMLVSVGASSPYTAYYSGINSYSLEGREPVRVGNLEGIIDPDFGPLAGHGLYARNAYLKGILRVLSGKNIEDIIEESKTRVGGVNLLREYDGRFDLKYWGEDGEIIDVEEVKPKTVLVLSDRYDVLVDEIDGKTTAFKMIL